MKTKSIVSWLLRGSALAVLLAALGASVGCMTTYDSYGRPVQSVDPAMAVAGAAAAGLIGYAIASDGDHHHHDYYGGGYYGRPSYYGGSGYHHR